MLDELRAHADAGEHAAAEQLAVLLADQGRWTKHLSLLRALADARSGYATMRLPHLLAEQGGVDELRALADAGDGLAAQRPAQLPDITEEQARAQQTRLNEQSKVGT